MLIIPAIDLRNGCCVRLTQGRKETAKVYDGNPVAIAKSFAAAGAEMVHVVDLDGAFSEPNSHNRQVLREIIQALEIPVQFGGGLRTVQGVKEVIDFGVSRVVIGTLAIESPAVIQTLVQLFGGDRIVVGIDSRGGQVVTRGWEKEAHLSEADLAISVASLGVERIIYTDVARDGMLEGVNVEATCAIARASGLKVTASGGVSSLPDITRLDNAKCDIDSVIVGKALYEGRFTIEQALAVAGQP